MLSKSQKKVFKKDSKNETITYQNMKDAAKAMQKLIALKCCI